MAPKKKPENDVVYDDIKTHFRKRRIRQTANANRLVTWITGGANMFRARMNQQARVNIEERALWSAVKIVLPLLPGAVGKVGGGLITLTGYIGAIISDRQLNAAIKAKGNSAANFALLVARWKGGLLKKVDEAQGAEIGVIKKLYRSRWERGTLTRAVLADCKKDFPIPKSLPTVTMRILKRIEKQFWIWYVRKYVRVQAVNMVVGRRIAGRRWRVSRGLNSTQIAYLCRMYLPVGVNRAPTALLGPPWKAQRDPRAWRPAGAGRPILRPGV